MSKKLQQRLSVRDYDGEKRAYVQHNAHEKRAFHSRKRGNEEQVSAARNGQKFGEALNKSEKNTLPNIHFALSPCLQSASVSV